MSFLSHSWYTNSNTFSNLSNTRYPCEFSSNYTLCNKTTTNTRIHEIAYCKLVRLSRRNGDDCREFVIVGSGFRTFSLSGSPLALSSMACIATMPHFKTSHTRPSLLSRTYTIGTASTRDTTYLVHFCWLTVSPSGVSESTSQRGRASGRTSERVSERTGEGASERTHAWDPHALPRRSILGSVSPGVRTREPDPVQDVQKPKILPAATGCLEHPSARMSKILFIFAARFRF